MDFICAFEGGCNFVQITKLIFPTPLPVLKYYELFKILLPCLCGVQVTNLTLLLWTSLYCCFLNTQHRPDSVHLLFLWSFCQVMMTIYQEECVYKIKWKTIFCNNSYIFIHFLFYFHFIFLFFIPRAYEIGPEDPRSNKLFESGLRNVTLDV